MDMNMTSSMPISVLSYLLDKAQYLGMEFFRYPLLFPNKKTVTQQSVGLFTWQIFYYNFILCDISYFKMMTRASHNLRINK